jgi:hypothetical protein
MILGGVLALFLIMSIVIFFYKKRYESATLGAKEQRQAGNL